MGVFVVLLLVPMLIQHVAIGKNYIDLEKKNRRALLVFFLIFSVLVALRHESVGTDTQRYIYFFNRLSGMEWHTIAKYPLEIGFSLFNKIVSVFTNEPQILLAITAFVTVAMMYPTYKRLCVDASLTIVLFCTMTMFVLMFSAIRQMLAVAIGFIAYECTRNKKPVPFIICVLIAMAFHTSAFMLLFMYPLYYIKITKRSLLAVIPILAIVFVFNKQIFAILGFFLERYTLYDANATQTGAYTMLILFSIFAVFAFLIPDESRLDNETIGLRNFLLFSLALQMFAPLHMIAMRMNYYYIAFIPLLLPKIISSRSRRYMQVVVLARYILIIFFLLYFFIKAYSGYNLEVFPYQFFWEDIR